jgi:hypothetical protein
MILQTAVFPSDLHKSTPSYIAERENRFIVLHLFIQCVQGPLSPRVKLLEREAGQDETLHCFYF